MASRSFRDFGITTDGLQPPADRVRCFLSPTQCVGQYAMTAVVCLIGLAVAALMAWSLPLPLNGLGCVGVLVGVGTFLQYVTRHDYRWIELDGETIRSKQLYSTSTHERSVAEIQGLVTMLHNVRRLETRVVEALLGRVKGIEIRFRDQRTPLRIMRADPAMVNAREFIEALLYRMQQHREVEAVVDQHAGEPVVRQIHWRDDGPLPAAKSEFQLILICGVGLATLFGPLLGLMGAEQQTRHQLSSVAPQIVSLQSLIQNGPGANRHVTITDFRPGGYVAEERQDAWTNLWIALFPIAEGNEAAPVEEGIRAVLSSSGITSHAMLEQMLEDGRVTGICSASPRTNWGATLGPRLVAHNPGSQLTSAWEIEELREPPSLTRVHAIFAGSTACFLATLALAAVIYLLRTRQRGDRSGS